MQFTRTTGCTADTFLEYIQRNLPEGVAMKVTKVSCLLKRPFHKMSIMFILGCNAIQSLRLKIMHLAVKKCFIHKNTIFQSLCGNVCDFRSMKMYPLTIAARDFLEDSKLSPVSVYLISNVVFIQYYLSFYVNKRAIRP